MFSEGIRAIQEYTMVERAIGVPITQTRLRLQLSFPNGLRFHFDIPIVPEHFYKGVVRNVNVHRLTILKRTLCRDSLSLYVCRI